MTQAQILGLVRAVLTSLGGALVTQGIVTNAQLSDVIGAILIIGGAVWSYLQKKQAHAALITAAATGVIAPPTATSTLTSPHDVSNVRA